MDYTEEVVRYLDTPYGVTQKGEVWSYRRNMWRRPYIKPGGYKVISYRTNTKPDVYKHLRVSRMVATVFLPNPNNWPQVNHIDGDPSNNCLDNLEWCTGSMNLLHAYRLGLRKPNHPSVMYPLNFSKRKLTNEQLDEIDKLIANGYKPFKISRITGITYGSVTAYAAGKTYKERHVVND